MNRLEGGGFTQEKVPEDYKLPEFFIKGNKDLNEESEGIYQSFPVNKDIRPLLEKYLAEIGKSMSGEIELPSFLDYVGDGFDMADDEEPEIQMDTKGKNVRQEWEAWLSKCPSKTNNDKE